jgi:tetratricopeptide (TPR) repeat protein
MTLWQAFRAASARDDALKAKLKLIESHQTAAEERASAVARSLETLGSANRLIQSGRSHFLFAEYAETHADLSAAIKIRPDHSYAWIARGEFYAHVGLWDLAASDFQRATQLQEPDTVSLLSQLALLRFYSGDDTGYRSVCERLAARADTVDARAYEEISRACLLSEHPIVDPEQLVRLAERSLGPSRPLVRLANLATAHYRAGQYERAIDRLREARATRPRYETIWLDSVLAMVHHRLGQPELARKSLDAATEVMDRKARTVSVMASIAWWYTLLEVLYYREAWQLIKGESYREDAGQWVYRGKSLAALGLHTDALASYDRAIALSPAFASAWEKRADVHALLGDWPKAFTDYERLLSLQPTRADVANTFAGILASCPEPSLRQPERAVKLAGQAASLAPSQPSNWRTLGIARYRAGDLRGSEQAMLKAMELNPAGHPVDRLFLAMALWKSGQKKQADQLYANTVSRDDWPVESAEEFARYCREAAALLGQDAESLSSRSDYGDNDPSIYTILLEIDPGAVWLYERRGYANAILKQWDQAAADFSRAATAHPEDPGLWYARAAAKLGAMDLNGYTEIRKEILARFGGTMIPAAANHVVYICLVTPTTEVEAQTLSRWGQFALSLTPEIPRARGAAFYRAGHYDAAVRDFTQASKVVPPRAWDSLFLAMAHHKLGHNQESRECLKKAEAWVERANQSRSRLSNSPWIGWYESVEVSYLLREARTMIQTNEHS